MNWLRGVWNVLRGAPRRPTRLLRDTEPVAFDPGLVCVLQSDHQRIERQALKLLDALRTADPAVCAWLADAARCALRTHLERAGALYPHLYATLDPGSPQFAAIEPLERDLLALVARFERFFQHGEACAWKGVRRVALAIRFEKTVSLMRVQFGQEESDLYPFYRGVADTVAEPYPLVEWHHDGLVEIMPLRVRPALARAR